MSKSKADLDSDLISDGQEDNSNPSDKAKPSSNKYPLGSKENPATLATPEGKAAFKEWLKTH